MNKANSLLSEFKNQCAENFLNGSRDNNLNIIKSESNDCTMWEHCEPIYIDYFESLSDYAKNGELSDDNISILRNKFDSMKELASESKQCSNCLQHAETCFESQIEMLQKMNFYQPDSNEQIQVQDLPEEHISILIGDALSSAVRVQILKALYDEGKSFTALSKLTKLRGGNLLFHLDKLQSKGLIHQREERGEYQISLQGHNLLNSLLEVVKALNIDKRKKD
ncbi:winged helix-turn-helix domain-containing protein [Methanococcoides alaskense]|uniref:DNA-binding transcriptional ArsR family regulator n=1 Tax=Methanococcoides alaskense TaxID=325778 RepID=A0AA90TX56_9EURY|nr:winged helix-turn-helix domain-containing protein [Methanococcoides alaskense]MDA0525368.1 winged helix-turn-helix domain-containing protein [Methanococcoides alaskense]MDR6221701.1 DNA-binding transcriptional ArsR family regulator [Methanococcoides alaskense]